MGGLDVLFFLFPEDVFAGVLLEFLDYERLAADVEFGLAGGLARRLRFYRGFVARLENDAGHDSTVVEYRNIIILPGQSSKTK